MKARTALCGTNCQLSIVNFFSDHFFCDIDWASLALLKIPAYILSDDADTEQLDAGKQEQEHNYGCVPRYGNAPGKLFNDDADQIDNGRDAADCTAKGCQPQRGRGKADNALNGIV